MNDYVHSDLTKQWGQELGFDENQLEKIAEVSLAMDRGLWTKPWAHFKIAGATVWAYFFLLLALVFGSLWFLGFAVHAIQDSISHGWMMPWNHNRKYQGIDGWENASPDTRQKIEQATKRFLLIFRKK